jgi:hypothetical protein
MNGRDVPAHDRWLTGFDQRRCADVERANAGEDTNRSNHDRAGKRHNDNAQMGAAVRTVHGMIHNDLPASLPLVAATGLNVHFTQPVGYADSAAKYRFTEA